MEHLKTLHEQNAELLCKLWWTVWSPVCFLQVQKCSCYQLDYSYSSAVHASTSKLILWNQKFQHGN